MRRAAVMLIIKDGLILAISRKYDSTKFGLVGGKVEDGETTIQCAIRETKEECGIDVLACEKIFSRVEESPFPDGEDFVTDCFYATDWNGEASSPEGDIVAWVSASQLISSVSGAFPEYNTKTLDAFRQLYPDIKIQGE